MSGFNRNNRSNGGGFRGGRDSGRDDRKRSFGRDRDRGSDRGSDRGFDRRDSNRPEMFRTVCDDCGRDCEVPFKPSGNKPVYCSDCYEKHGNGGENSRDSQRSFRKPEGRNDGENYRELKKQLDEVNKKLDELLNAVLKPKTIRVKKGDIKE